MLGMTPREVERAVEWAESGWMTARGLLASGMPCGFTVVLGSGAVSEWSVRPVRYLAVRTTGTCPVDRQHALPGGSRT
ncbi:hypothetical protein V1460_33490 [Streptomyces sp. SCSIO 30461]|uniref:hypothetical protein n=1 Tax=Streptomyces sp. SCSIO 30461 TaxID=3118085 RepID=UPI0030D3BCCE